VPPLSVLTDCCVWLKAVQYCRENLEVIEHLVRAFHNTDNVTCVAVAAVRIIVKKVSVKIDIA
jgi:hypothetical protein